MQLNFRKGTPADAPKIAQLHAKSWKLHYQNVMTAEYLAEKVDAERQTLWEKRFAEENENWKVILAESDGKLCGFSCIFFDDDAKYGTLLDNLHVDKDLQGIGIGAALLKKTAEHCLENRPNAPLFLWVYTVNLPAIGFYKHMGGVIVETCQEDTADGGTAHCHRVLWKDLKVLLK